MKPRLQELKLRCPTLDENLLKEHLKRLEVRYYDLFDLEEVCAHLLGISRLAQEDPVQLILKGGQPKEVECTILAFDYPFEFSLITGVLASVGFQIVSGSVARATSP